MANEKPGNIKITLIKSLICSDRKTRETVKSLGLGRLRSSAIQAATPDILGKVKRVAHLVTVADAD